MRLALLLLLTVLAACSRADAQPAMVDVVIRGGTIHDGRGGTPFTGDVAIEGDLIVEVAARVARRGRAEVHARGLAVAPGFINVLSHAFPAVHADGRAESDVRQGVTLEIFGERSWGPLDERLRQYTRDNQGEVRFPVEWSTLDEFLAFVERRGLSPNVASFVSAGTIRQLVVGPTNRPATARELARMRALVDQAMRDGALGLTTALIYPPASFASTDELIALARVAARHGGLYVAHLRDEGERLLEAVDEHLRIARAARIPAEIYHLKAAGEGNWGKLDAAIRKIEAARAEGLRITADVYPYAAAQTGLTAWLPAWLQDGGTRALMKRLADPAVRARAVAEMRASPALPGRMVTTPEKIVLAQLRTPALAPLTGKTLAAVAAARGKSAEETAMDLIVEDASRIECFYFMMSEANVSRLVALPWVSFGSDAPVYSGDQESRGRPHPRAFGTFARLLGRYARDEKVVPLPEAIRRLTSFPAETFGIPKRGVLAPGFHADVVVFDPAKIRDHATYDRPHQYATGVSHVFVNGVAVLKDGVHTGAKPGRAVRRGRR